MPPKGKLVASKEAKAKAADSRRSKTVAASPKALPSKDTEEMG